MSTSAHVVCWVSALAMLSCNSKPNAAKPRPAPLVAVETAARKDVAVTVHASVELQPAEQADVSSKTVGYLDAVLVDRGDAVKKGQLLALVRPSDLPDQLLVAKSAVSQAQAAASLAKINNERAQVLAAKGLVSEQELYTLANAVTTADAQLQAAQAQLGVLATRLGETRLEAPFSGVVLARYGDPGALVGGVSGRPIVTVARMHPLRAFGTVSEREAAGIRVGQSARIVFDGLEGEHLDARVHRVAPALDVSTRNLALELQFSSPHEKLKPGMYGRAEIEVERHASAVVIPSAAVQLANEMAYVFVLEGEAVRRQPVRVGVVHNEEVEIVDGLDAGVVYVLRGIDGLSNGAKVRVPRDQP